MPRGPKTPLSKPVMAEIPRRLHNAAEAFYFAAILSSTLFYGRGAAPNQHYTVDRALEGILNSSNRRNQVDAPPLVNFAFSIELYIKLLRFLVGGELIEGHNLDDLFLEMDRAAPNVGAAVIRNHRYARGDRSKFLEYLNEAKAVFTHWRYAHENEFLIATPDNLHALADAFRATMRELHPGHQSVFDRTATSP